MLKLLALISIACNISLAFGTTFVPISLKVQIKEADSIIYGEVMAKDYEEVDEGMIATKYLVKLDKWLGLPEIKDQEIEVFTPGGIIGERTLEVPGTANLAIGEKVVLFLGKDNSGHAWIRNMGLGKYSAKKVGNSVVLVNQVFPFHPKMGQISLSYFIAKAQRIKNEKFEERFKDKYEIQASKQATIRKIKNRGRNIASTEDEQVPSKNTSPFWLVFILGSLGGIAAIIHRRYSDK